MQGFTSSEPRCYSSTYRLEFFGQPVYEKGEESSDLVIPVPEPTKIINVASVPQRSPFRYPGGKTWLVPYARRWLRSQPRLVEELIEPFAGGGIVGLTAAFERLAKRVTLVEIDPDIAAVWLAIVGGDGPWLAERITAFRLTPQSVRSILESEPRGTKERAFATIVRNRVQRGGILAPGAGLLRRGENGRGIGSRWYPDTLARRILNIAEIRDRITFIEGDGLEYMNSQSRRAQVAHFIDPPYTVAARRLYRYSEIDHGHLFRTAEGLAGDFLMTYDNTAEIRELAGKFNFEMKTVAMKNTHHARMRELLIGRSLAWVQGSISSGAACRGFEPQKLQGSPGLLQ
jgi:DNA adenine methylase